MNPQRATDKDKCVYPVECGNLLPKPNTLWLFIGGTGAGKTTFLQNIVDRMIWPNGRSYWQRRYFCGPTVHRGGDGLYAHLQESELKTDPSPDWLDEVMDRQKKEIAKVGIESAKPLLLVFEDIGHMRQLMNSHQMMEAVLTHRHMLITPVFLAQAIRGLVPRPLRLQTSYLFFKPSTASENEIIAHEFAPAMWSTKDFVRKIIGAVAREPHGWLVVCRPCPDDLRYRLGLDRVFAIKKNV